MKMDENVSVYIASNYLNGNIHPQLEQSKEGNKAEYQPERD